MVKLKVLKNFLDVKIADNRYMGEIFETDEQRAKELLSNPAGIVEYADRELRKEAKKLETPKEETKKVVTLEPPLKTPENFTEEVNTDKKIDSGNVINDSTKTEETKKKVTRRYKGASKKK